MNIAKNLVIHIRNWIKIILVLILALLIIMAILSSTYKITYRVALNNELVGYTKDKNKLQKRINDYTQSNNDEQVEFIQIKAMPSYNICFVKKDIQENDDEIYGKVIQDGVKYYKYYAITENGEEKKYVDEYAQAESVVNTLKEKNSTNIEQLGILEKYDVELKELSNVDNCVNELFMKPEEKRVVEKKSVTVASDTNKNKKYSSEVKLGGTNSTGKKVELGIAFINPTSGVISSRFGIRSRDNHKGLDIAASYGTPIKASATGKVIYSGYSTNGYGNHVIISHGNGVQTLYGHCSSLCVKEGQTVQQGTVIAKVGSTGISTGNHLHFEIRKNGVAQDPENYTYK